MALFLAALTLLLIYLLPLFCLALRRDATGVRRDVFEPALFFCGLGLLNVPYLFLIAANPDNRSFELRMSRWVNDLEWTAVAYVVISAVMLALLMLGAYSRWARSLGDRLPVMDPARFTAGRVSAAAVATGALGMGMYLYFIQQIGGLSFLWQNIYLRALLGAGMGYLSMAYSLMLTLCAGLVIYRMRFRRGPVRWLLAGLVVAFLCAVMLSMGGRAPLLTVLVLVVLTAHYGVRRRRRLLTPGIITLGVLMLLVGIVMPMFRKKDALARYSGNPAIMVDDVMRNVSYVAPQFSQFDRTAVMLNYFTPERLWLGRGYVDLLYAPIPRSMFKRKPPVDDGVYFKEIADGRPTTPSRPAHEMRPTSWPMGTLTTYMNFGPAGLMAAMLFSGLLVGATYHWMRRSGYNPFAIFIYSVVAMGGPQLSVYGIVYFTINVVLAFAVFWLFFGRKPFVLPAPAAAAVPAGASA